MKHSTSILAALTLLGSAAFFAFTFVLLKSSKTATVLISKRSGDGKDCSTKRLLLISFDGFRWNYLSRTATPNFDKFIDNGVQARLGLTNAFVTKTFPNHYTIVTGVWEESHGIIANDMYDPVLNQTFRPRNISANRDPAWFDMGAEPLWVTNQLRGKGHSGILMWVGVSAPIRNTLPTKYMEYKEDYKNETKIENIITWFKEDCQMNLGMTYFPQPDRYGHKFGPESEQVTQMIGGLDDVIGYLLKRFDEEGLLESTNIILTSDHGFASTPSSKLIDLDKIINRKKRFISDISPDAAIWPHKGYEDEIFKNLTVAQKTNGHFTVYKKEDIPEHFHYTNSRRIPPILVVADEFYSFTAYGFGQPRLGNHGYDNRLGDMHPFFLAMGPDFKSGFSVDNFDIVDLYPLMCHLLDVPPAPNNGSMEVVSSLLKASSDWTKYTEVWHNAAYMVPLAAVAVSIIIALIFSTIYFCRHHESKEKDSAFEEDEDEEKETSIYSFDSDQVPLL